MIRGQRHRPDLRGYHSRVDCIDANKKVSFKTKTFLSQIFNFLAIFLILNIYFKKNYFKYVGVCDLSFITCCVYYYHFNLIDLEDRRGIFM
jgi:hypothetical protein